MISKGRLEAFSDGVIAIIITIMVLELKVPHTDGLEALVSLFPVLISYILSFLYVGIYWNNHHHVYQLPTKIPQKILWLDMACLVVASLVPLASGGRRGLLSHTSTPRTR